MRSRLLAPFGLLLVLAAGCSAPPGAGEPLGSSSSAITGQSIASLALANVGKGACSTNSLGGTAFDSSCTGNGGLPEYWCADFARWVWANAGASNTSELTAAAGSFYVFGQNHGTLHSSPALGDAVVFNYQGGGYADHVALVTQVNSNGTIETVSGDWNGQSGSEATFASTSHAILNFPAYADGQGSTPGIMGMTISGYVSPIGLASADYGASYVSQSFPLATTALHMVAGQTLAASITLRNSGGKPWNGNTRLATTQPRDRASDFADGSWVSPSRLASVTGSVAPGGTFTFHFNFHAPSTPGTYHEYFGMVQDGVAWFSDPGQGGPPDNDLEAQIIVSAGPDAGTDAGTDAGEHDASEDSGKGVANADGGTTPEMDAAAPAAPGPGAPEGPPASSDPAPASPGETASGCAVARAPAAPASGSSLLVLGCLLLGMVARRKAREGR